jgi:AcrR family transcriptional regulator
VVITSEDLASIQVVAGHVKPDRAAKAAATRRRICASAQRRFVAAGYTGTTMEAVAADAGVAVQTVYFVFHTKAELLRATFDAAVLGDFDAPPPQAQEWFRRALDEPDPGRAIDVFVAGNARIHARLGPLVGVLQASGVAEVRELFEDRERLRWEGYHLFAKSLRRRGALRGSTKDATDVLFAMCGPQLHAVLAERGWSARKWERWTSAALRRQLLG